MATTPRYILLENRSGEYLDGTRNPFPLARGTILEFLPELEQPEDPKQIALTVISIRYITLVFHKLYVSQLTDSEADLLGTVESPEETLRIYRDKNRLTEAKTFNIGSKVFVKIRKQNTELELRGVIRYEGNFQIPSFLDYGTGTMFGVELLDKAGYYTGVTDGTYRGTRYFTCPAGRGIFVAVDKLRPRQDQDQETEECVGQESDGRLAELATSLDEERKIREEVERRLHSSEQRSHELELSFAAERQAHQETERRLRSNEQRLEETERRLRSNEQRLEETERRLRSNEQSLDEERQAHQETERRLRSNEQRLEETERRLRSNEQRSNALQTSLTAETQAHQETERRLRSIEQSLDEEREAHQEIERSLRSNEQRLEETERRLRSNEQSLDEERQAHQETERRLRSNEQSLDEEREAHQEIERSLRSNEQRLEETERRLRSNEQSLDEERQAHQETERRLRSNEQSLDEERQAHQETERRLRSNEQSLDEEREAHQETASRLQSSEERSDELQTTLSTVRQAYEDYRRSIESTRDWVVRRDEIRLSDKVIGVGAWGEVKEGTFRGCKVAVKKIHELILSDQNKRLFEREMNMASRCRHPCLLQFIGATNDADQSPLFVTELLDTSLRSVLRERPLEPPEITTIALDVAKGLNYLHLSHPAPIIHRDISNANVLLWKHVTIWRAKVSDYGTAKFLQQSMTVCPGAVAYSAPEAQTSRQSPKLDVYSFGVLLCEMNVREMPDPDHRNEQVAMVTNNLFRNLIRRCLQQNPEERPSMAEIIETLENSQR